MSKNKDAPGIMLPGDNASSTGLEMSDERWAYIKQLAPSRGSYVDGSRGRTYKAGRNAAKRAKREAQ